MTWTPRQHSSALRHRAWARKPRPVQRQADRDKTAQPWFLNARGEPERWLAQGLLTVAVVSRDVPSRWQGRTLHASGEMVALSRRYPTREDAQAACDAALTAAGWRLT